MHKLGYRFDLCMYFALPSVRLYSVNCLFSSNILIGHLQGDSEELIGKWFARTGNRDKIFLATKFGVSAEPDGVRIRGDPDFIRKTVKTSLERLQTDHIDLLYQHRPDGKVPIEVTVRTMKEFFE